MNLSTRVKRLETVAGIGGPCEACELSAAYDAWLGELTRAWGIPTQPQDRRIKVSCVWCARVTTFPAAGFTPEEVAAYERSDALFWRGEMCAPEAERLREIVAAAEARMMRERYGDHAEDVRRLIAEYGEGFEAITEMRAATAYLCRVPGCGCEYPKTFDEWRELVTANGCTVRGFVSA